MPLLRSRERSDSPVICTPMTIRPPLKGIDEREDFSNADSKQNSMPLLPMRAPRMQRGKGPHMPPTTPSTRFSPATSSRSPSSLPPCVHAAHAKKKPKWVVACRSLAVFVWQLLLLLCIAVVVSSVVGYVSSWLRQPGHVDLIRQAVPDVVVNATSATMNVVRNNLAETKELVDHLSEAYS